jgi:hypothetical protein
VEGEGRRPLQHLECGFETGEAGYRAVLVFERALSIVDNVTSKDHISAISFLLSMMELSGA